jgi:hypothetical protein
MKQGKCTFKSKKRKQKLNRVDIIVQYTGSVCSIQCSDKKNSIDVTCTHSNRGTVEPFARQCGDFCAVHSKYIELAKTDGYKIQTRPLTR